MNDPTAAPGPAARLGDRRRAGSPRGARSTRPAPSPRRRSPGSRRSTDGSTPTPTSPPSGRWREAAAVDADARRRAAARAARGRALRGQEPLRRRRACRPGRGRGSTATARRRRADAELVRRMTRGRGGAARRAQHGRVRLRLHRRERPRRRLPQPARSGADERRLVLGLRRGDRRRARADLARLGHQRLAPGAGVALRRLQPEADLRPAAADRRLSVRRQPRPPRADGAHRRAISRSPTTRCRAPIPRDHACAGRAVEPVDARRSARGVGGLRVGVLGGWFRANAGTRGAAARGARRRRRSRAAARGRAGDARRRRGGPRRGLPHHQCRERRLPPRPAAQPGRRTSTPTPATGSSPARCCRRPGSSAPSGCGAGGSSRRSRRSATSTCCSRRRRPCPAPAIGAQAARGSAAATVPLRPCLGLLAQPFSCIGLPVATVPVFAAGALPIGVQIVAPPWREDLCLRVAGDLEASGASTAHPPAAC